MFPVAPFALASLLLSTTASFGAPSPPSIGSETYLVTLSGDAEMNELLEPSGDRDGSGTVRITVDPVGRRICYDFAVAELATPLMAHIHRGSPEDIGPSVVTLFTGPGEMRDCKAWTEKRLAEITANPSNFYVNLYTTEFPDGALRGQLSG